MTQQPTSIDPRRQRRFALVASLCALGLLQAPIAGLAAVQARLAGSARGQITLDIESDTPILGAQPDLSPLNQDFVVLGTSTQSETRIVNGSRSSSERWSVRLRPRQAGALTIPPIAVGNERTAALQVDVSAPSPQAVAEAKQHVFVEVESADTGRSVYVQQQIPYTVRLYADDTIEKGELAVPSLPDAVVEQLGEEKHSTAMRDGREYRVIERTYAISPEKSGSLRIPPLTFNGSQAAPPNAQAQPGNDPASDPADDLFARMLRGTPFANDPLLRQGLGGTPFADDTRPVAAQSRTIVFDVKPRPAAARGEWLPAEGITLHDSWQDNPPTLKVGEPVTRTITVEAKGLSASQIPSLSLQQPDHARIYPEAADNQSRTDGKTIFGISRQKLTYIPSAEGRLDVQPVDLAWWDVAADQPRHASLPAMTLAVAPGVAGASSANVPPVAAAPRLAPAPVAVDAAPSHIDGAWMRRLADHRIGIAAAVLLAVLLLALGVPVVRSRRRPAKGVTRLSAPRQADSLNALRRACLADDRTAAAQALNDLARARWPADPPLGLGALASRLEEGSDEVRVLERSLYRKSAGESEAAAWQGAALWQALRRGLRERRDAAGGRVDGLAALYPSRS